MPYGGLFLLDTKSKERKKRKDIDFLSKIYRHGQERISAILPIVNQTDVVSLQTSQLAAD